jgi:glycosyltransferase involved in cell wall biosynthesis
VSGLRVALLSYRSKPHCGGQGVYVRHLGRELARLGHRVTVFSGQPYPRLDPAVALHPLPSLDLYREPDPFRTPALAEFRDLIDVLEVATMYTAGFPEPLTFSLRAARALRGRGRDFDVVHDNQSLGYGLLAIRRGGLPVLATIHHPITEDRRHELAVAEGWRRLSLRRWYGFARMQRRVAPRLDGVITVSRSSRDGIVADFGVDPARLRVVPVGVDPVTFAPPDGPRVPGRLVAMASADVPLKGQQVLLRALALLRAEHPDAHLVCVGSPRPGGPTERLLAELGLGPAIRYVSGLSDAELSALLGSASLAVVPSLYEGFSLPAVEAMACATPLVASATGGLPEVVGDCARLVPPGDPQALAAAAGELLGDPAARAALGAAGRERVRARYCWRAVAAATADCYAGLAGARSAAVPRPPAEFAEVAAAC